MITKFLSMTLLAVSLVALPSVAQSTHKGNHGYSKTECKVSKKAECQKNSNFATAYNCDEVYNLSSQIKIGDDKAQFHKIFSDDNGSVVLVALKGGQSIGTHTAPENVMVYVLEGDIEFTTPGKVNRIKSGEFMLMRADVPHSLKAFADSKITLVKIRP